MESGLVKIQIISDIHLEAGHKIRWDNCLEPVGDILILAGDICYLKDFFSNSIVAEFISYVKNNWKHIIYVPGNHEFYQMCYNESFCQPNYINPEDWITISDNAFKHLNFQYGNLHLVNNDVIEIDGINFVCSTLWSQIPPQHEHAVKHALADFRYIGKMNPSNFNYLNKEAITFVRNSVCKYDNIVVISHHLPSWAFVSNKYKTDMVTYGFANQHIDNLATNPNIKLWIHGHSHDSLDITINDVRHIRNPFGYKHELNTGYIKNKVIEI